MPALKNANYWKEKQNWICGLCKDNPQPTTDSNLDEFEFSNSLFLDQSTLEKSGTSHRYNPVKKGPLFGHVNINSIRNKFEEAKDMLLQEKFVVMAFTESKLQERDQTSMYTVAGYDIIREDRANREGGGILIFVSKQCTWRYFTFSTKFPLETQVICLVISQKFTKPVLFITVYNPPLVSKTEFLAAFEKLLVEVEFLEFEKIIMGDFNLNLLTVDTHSVKLFNMCKKFGL